MDHQILDQLRRDHDNIRLLLKLLADQVGRFRSGESVDYALVEDALRYLTGYSDIYHHPLEDELYRELKSAAPDAAAAVQQTVDQHDALVDEGRETMERVEAIEESAIVRRDKLLELVDHYWYALGRHMMFEERYLFPLAAERLSAENWDAIEARMNDAPDPLFGPAVEADYRNLLSRLSA